MTIPYDGSTPLVHVFGLYQIPASMADSIDQYRLDILSAATESLGIEERHHAFLAPEPGSEQTHIAGLFDPLSYYDFTPPQYVAPSSAVVLPQAPAVLAELSLQVRQLLSPFIPRMSEKLRMATDEEVLLLAHLVARAFLSEVPLLTTREEATAYLAYSNVDNPGAKLLRKRPDVWKAYMRVLEIPDMVAARKRDFIELFQGIGKPLLPEELNCVSQERLLEYASDMRAYVLDQNRHVVFCRKCSNRMIQINTQVMTSPEDWLT